MIKIDANNYGTDTAAQVQLTFTGETGRRWAFAGLAWSYTGSTLDTGAALNIFRVDTQASNQIFGIGTSAFGPGFIIPSEMFELPSDDDIIVELTSGGASNVGRLNVLGVRKL